MKVIICSSLSGETTPLPVRYERTAGYVYHLTPRSNLKSIYKKGLVPNMMSKFSPLSPEARIRKKKVYFLPSLHGSGMKGFLDEWWHGDVSDIYVLRIRVSDVELWSSSDRYYARQEVWAYSTVTPDLLQYSKFTEKPIWLPLPGR